MSMNFDGKELRRKGSMHAVERIDLCPIYKIVLILNYSANVAHFLLMPQNALIY
jgi:hypothetical protein